MSGIFGLLRGTPKSQPAVSEVPDPFHTDVDGHYERAEGTEQYPSRRVINRTGEAESEIWYSGNFAIAKVAGRSASYHKPYAVNLHVPLHLGESKHEDYCVLTLGDAGVQADIHVRWDALIELARVIAELAKER